MYSPSEEVAATVNITWRTINNIAIVTVHFYALNRHNHHNLIQVGKIEGACSTCGSGEVYNNYVIISYTLRSPKVLHRVTFMNNCFC